MDIIRFILPFLFVRNWYDGEWELSRPRLYALLILIALVAAVLVAAYFMQSPIDYHG